MEDAIAEKRGFTLLETLIVLAVIGILLTIAVPSMYALLRDVREQVTLANCREAVLAGSLIALDEQVNAGLTSPEQLDTPEMRAEILRTAGISGEILQVRVSTLLGSVTYLEYQNSASILAAYDAARDPSYYIVGDSIAGAPDYRRSADDLLLSSDILDTVAQRDKQTQALQSLFLEENGGVYPALTEEEQAILSDGGYDQTISLNWRPILSSSGELILAASDAAVSTSNPIGAMVFYEGRYFYWYHYGKIKTAYISDQNFDISVLDPDLTEPPSNNGIWLCYGE